MQYRSLGNTGLRVSVLGFGGAEIGYENASQAEVDRIVNSAIEAGVNVFDTAECYGDSEHKLGCALSGRRDNVFLFTKCGHASGLEGPDWAPTMLAQSIDRSLMRLRTDHVDLIQLHSCARSTLLYDEVLNVLGRAKRAGKVRFMGYSGDSADALAAVQSGCFDTLQTSLNIADQEAISLTLPIAHAAGMGVIAKRSIANAVWKFATVPDNPYYSTYWERLRRLNYDFLNASFENAVSTALKFTLRVDGVKIAIVGTKNPERWQQNTEIVDSQHMQESTFTDIRNRWLAVAGVDWVGQV